MYKIVICMLGALFVLLVNSIPQMYFVTFVSTSLACALSLFLKRKPLLIYAFHLGLIIFVFPDGFMANERTLAMPRDTTEFRAATYICMSILFFNIIYWFFLKKLKSLKHKYKIIVNSYALYLIILIEVIYLICTFRFTYQSFFFGRASGVDLGGLNVAFRGVFIILAIIIPGLVSFAVVNMQNKFKKSFLVSLLFSIPVFIYLFLQGNRFPLLFSASIFLFVNYPKYLKFSRADISRIFVVIIVGLLLSTVMVELRNRAYGVNNSSISYGVLKSEGILDSNVMLISFFDHNEHKYGSSLGNILFFWVPRAFWEDKPTYLGYWLVRAVSDGYIHEQFSAGFGFGGEAYADFGFYGGIFICGLFGFVFTRLENFCFLYKEIDSGNFLFCLLLVPFSFFFVRNIDTAFFILFSSGLFFKLFLKFLTKQYKITYAGTINGNF